MQTPPLVHGGFPAPFRVAGTAALIFSALATPSPGQVDMEINRAVWKQKFGVTDARMNDANWLSQDADGDGVKNRDEFLAGTNPFRKSPGEPHFWPPAVTNQPAALSLQFPTVPGKFYQIEAGNLIDAWTAATLPATAGDGGMKTVEVPKDAGHFFRIAVSDRSSQGDQISDWAKLVLGFSPGAPLASQSSYDRNSLASSLGAQNVISLEVANAATTQPPDAGTPAGDVGLIRVKRSGSILPGAITVPLVKSGTAIEGSDYAPLPAALVFPAGVNSLDLRITPLANPNRRSTATVIISAAPPDAASADGNYSLGTPASGGVTINPSGLANGSGLTGTFYPGSSATYTSPLNFSDQVAATYAYTKINTTSGTAVVTYSSAPAVPFAAGGTISLQFISGNLNTAAFNTLKNYTIASVTATTVTVNLTGTAMPGTGTGNSIIGGFSPPVTLLFPGIDATWGHGTPNAINYINADNYSVTWSGFLSPSTAGNYTFKLDADDKARVFLDLGDGNGFQQILENGWDGPATGTYQSSAPIALTVPAAPANRYPIRVEFVETTGSAKCKFQWQLNNGTAVVIPSANVFTTSSGNTAGWTGVYYNNPAFTPPAARTQTDTDLTAGNSGDWLGGSPDPAVFHNNFSARWTGQILPQYSQTYYFVTKANEGSKLWINNQLIIDKWTGASGSEQTAAIDLQANVLYDIKLEYYETTGSSEVHLSWYSEDQAKQIIPANRLFPGTGVSPAPPAITSPRDAVAILGADTPVSINVSSSNGGVISASGLPPWLTLAGNTLTGTPAAAGIYQFTLTTTNAAGTSSVIMTLEVLSTDGRLTRDLWTSGVTGPSIANVPWQSAPSSSDTVPLAEDDGSYPANTGERLRGYFTAPATGNYYFWIAAGNSAELWISNNSEPAAKVLRAKVSPPGTAPRTWDAQAGQKSGWLSLTAGQKYYLEVLHNTGSSGSSNHLSVAWFLDPTGNTATPIANGGGLIPPQVISSWDNPPTISVPGTLYVTNLQGAEGIGNITATGGAFLRVNGSGAVLQLNYSGLTSGVVSRKIYDKDGRVLFDIDAQEKNYPALKTTDGGYTWSIQGDALAALENGEVHLGIATINHPTGEITGTFGRIAGSQTAPPPPSYPSWPDQHASSDAANSRFLTQATFGPGPADMAAVKATGYRAWIDDQFNLPATHNIPYILANLSNDPQNPYPSTLLFNSWWKNSITAPDQLRQRAAFALSEIFVVSDTGPLNNNGRALADYYDTLLDCSLGNFRDVLKQVTLAPAMGVYLDMRGNAAGNIANGVHPNENYAREILQLFSAGLYRTWPDGTLVLDSKGAAVPTYDQNVITGFARVFTGWNWGQPLSGGRLPTSFSPSSNYLDPMILVPSKHELGSKILLDNVILPPATVTTSSDTSTEPGSTYSVQSTDPALGAGNTVTTTITNRYDLNGIRDLEQALDNIMNNPAVSSFICRQLIQRLVTSNPKPEYVHRVVRAFNGERNVDGIATGIKGDMKEVFRAILLDYEARSPAAAAGTGFGKQREPLLRITGPARSFPAAPITNSRYRQTGLQQMLVTSPVPHRLGSENILLNDFADAGGSTTNLPASQAYASANATPSYSLAGATGIATITAPGYQAGDTVALQFTSGTLGSNATYKSLRDYTVLTATATNFTINIGSTAFANSSGNTSTPYNFTINLGNLTTPAYTSTGNSVTIAGGGFSAGHKIYIKFSSGGLLAAGFDGVHTIASATSGNFTITLPSAPANTTGTVLIPRLSGGYNITAAGSGSSVALQCSGNHNLKTGDSVQVDFLVTNSGIPAQDGVYTVTGIKSPNVFTIATPTPVGNGSQSSNGMYAYPLDPPQWNRSGTLTIGLGTWSVGSSQNDLNQTPLNSATVFNFFYPDYQYPGEMARAGMTTPEFQLTNDSNIMNLTNAVTGSILSSGNPNGYTSYKSGGGAVVSDFGPYMTEARTSNAGIPALVDSIGTLMTGGNLSPAARSVIINYVANPTNFPLASPPTNTQMRDRVRAVIHLIATSAEYAVQK